MLAYKHIYIYIYMHTNILQFMFFYAHCNCMYILCICAQLIGNIYLFVTYMCTACAYVVCLWMYTCMCISMYVYSHMYNITERSFFLFLISQVQSCYISYFGNGEQIYSCSGCILQILVRIKFFILKDRP